VVLHPGRRAEEAELRGYLFDRLSPFKIPSRIVVVDRIPRSSIGKVQRKRMAGLLQGALTSAPEGPVTKTERILADLFRESIPGHPETGRNSHFFSLGGDSLHAIRMVQRVGDRFGIELPAHEVFRHPTPALLAVRVEEMRKRMLLDTLKARFSTLTEEQRSVILEKLKRDS
jgi:acyl carrier protein